MLSGHYSVFFVGILIYMYLTVYITRVEDSEH